MSNIGSEETNSKKEVYYKELAYEPSLGGCAFLWPINHPSKLISNQQFVQTSRVVAYDPETKIIETLNTIYIPLE